MTSTKDKNTAESITTIRIKKSDTYVKQFSFVSDDGIYVPLEEYAPEGFASNYKCLMTKEIFIEAYNKWIKED